MLHDWLYRLRALARRGRVEDELDDEIGFHVAQQVERYMARGMSPDEARRAAAREFGGVEQIKEECRDARGVTLVEQWWADARHALRSLIRVPVMTAAIALTVGIGIGATTVMFGAVDAALLRPLPYADPARLVRVYIDSPPNQFRFSAVDYLALEAQQTHFAQVAAYTDKAMAFSDGEQAERLRGRAVSWNYFALLGVRPVLGRSFTHADGRVGAPPAVVVSHAFWQRRLGGRASAVGRPIRLDGQEHVLAGVLPPRVGPLEQRADFFVAAQWRPPSRKGPFLFTVIGRLRPDASRSAAAGELRAISRRLFPIWRASYQDERASWAMMDLGRFVAGDVRPLAALALGAVALVWLISCANASNLLIARVAGRQRELALRAALGASRARVVQHLAAESAWLALAAAAVGVALALAGTRLLRAFGSGYFPRTQEIALDGASLGVLVALTLASLVLFGLVPAVQGARRTPLHALRAKGPSFTGGVSERKMRRLLVAVQFAITTPLLVTAVLLLTTLHHLGRVDVGFDTRNLLTAGIALPASQYPEPAQVVGFWDELQRRIERAPGVASLAFADGRAPNDVDNFNNFDLEALPTPRGGSQPVTPWVTVSPGYFRTLGLQLVEGRVFDDRDGRTSNLEAVVVDRAWAKRFFPGGSTIGRRLRQGGCTTCPWTTVVGVVSDVKYAGLDKPGEGTVYAPLDARALPSPTEDLISRFRYVIVRTRMEPASILPELQRIVHDLDPALPMVNVATIDELVDLSLRRPRSLSMFVTGFALVALALSVIGIYGVMSYFVQQHSKAISIRLALGGRPAQVMRMVVGQGMGVVAGGVAVGLLAALGVTRLVSSLLFGVGATDPVTYLLVGAGLACMALAACALPARQATRLDPTVALREE